MMQRFACVLVVVFGSLIAQAQKKSSYYQDVQPIVHSRCATCHRPGGGAPFSLISYDDLAKRGSFVKEVVSSGYMPPWKANDHYTTFSNSRKLTDEERQKLLNWIDSGMPRGKVDMRNENKLQKEIASGTTFGRPPDLTLKMNYSYRVKADGKEHFMVFKIPFELGAENNVEAVEFMTNNKRVVHHANFAIHPVVDPSVDIHKTVDSIDLNTSRHTYAQWLPYKNEMRYYGGWIPGASFQKYPEKMGWVMPKRGVLLLTIHYSPAGKEEQSICGINLFFKKSPIERVVKVISLGSGGIGERDIYPPLLLFPEKVETYRLRIANSREDISVLYVWPHMHYLGKEFKAYATRETTDTIRLVHIPSWDFRWQEVYRNQKPAVLKRGDVVHMYGTYDNTSANPMNPNDPPIFVESTGDMRSDQEMFTMLMIYVSYLPGDEDLVLDP